MELLRPDDFTDFLGRAMYRHSIELSPNAAGYLEGMMKDFIACEGFTPEIASEIRRRVIQNGDLPVNPETLRQIGDQCLFATGLFYERISRRGSGEVEFVTDIGRHAYRCTGQAKGPLFIELSDKFKGLVFVISDFRLPELDDDRKLVKIIDKWMMTNDAYYLSLLKGKGIDISYGDA